MPKIEIEFMETRLPGQAHADRKFQTHWQKFMTWWEILSQDERNSFKHFLPDANENGKTIVDRILQASKRKDAYIVTVNGSQLLGRLFPDPLEFFRAKLAALSKEIKALCKLVPPFLIQVELQIDPQIQQRLLIKSLKRRNNKLFKEAMAEWQEAMEQDKQKTLILAENQWWAAHQNYYHLKTEHFSTDKNLFIEVLTSFDLFRQLAVMRNYLELLNHGQSLLTNGDPMIQQLQQDAAAIIQQEEKTPLIGMYCELAQMMTKGGLAHYPRFVQIYLKHNLEMAKIDHIVLNKIVINYFNRLHKRSQSETHSRQIFAWMLQALRQDLYHFEGTISDASYLNFFTMACRLNKAECYALFAEKYGHLLDLGIKDLVIHWCEIMLLFKNQEYLAAREKLTQHFPLYSKLETKYDFRIKDLRVMVNYHCKVLYINDKHANEDLDNSILNLTQYCRRMIGKGMNVQEANDYLQFVKIVQALNHFQDMKATQRNVSDQHRLQAKHIQQLFEQADSVVNGSWLQRQIDQVQASIQ